MNPPILAPHQAYMAEWVAQQVREGPSRFEAVMAAAYEGRGPYEADEPCAEVSSLPNKQSIKF